MLNYLIEYNRYMHIVGIVFIILLAFLCSDAKKRINYKIVLNALLLQFLIAFSVLKTSIGSSVISKFANAMSSLYEFAGCGVRFLFGNLALNQSPWGSVFAIQVLPMIIFFGAFTSLLFHFGIIQRFVSFFSFLIRPILKTTDPETLCAVANIFLGQTESPLLIKNYLSSMTRSEIFVVMVSGMGTISGALLAVYAKMGAPIEHLLASSVISIPGSILIAKMIIPETEKSHFEDDSNISFESNTNNVFDAIFVGTSDGLQLALNVGAMLLSFIAIIFMINSILSFFYPSLSLDLIFSYLFLPFSYVLGATGQEAFVVSKLLGVKVAINEFLAYMQLASLNLSPRMMALVTYALCGFSNFSCIGIQVGGIGSLAPDKKRLLTELGVKAVISGALTNLLTACIAGLFI